MAESTHDDEKTNDTREVQMVEHAINREAEMSILETIKANPKVLLYSILMTTGPLIFGYDSIIVGVSLGIPSFQ